MTIRLELLPPGHSEFAGIHLAQGLVALARGDAVTAERELTEGQAIVAALESPDRVPIDAIEIALARAVALQGRTAEGLAIAREAVDRMQANMAPGHWQRRAAEAIIGLPPLVVQPTAAALTQAETTLTKLREELGPNAPSVREIEAALVASAPGNR